MRKQAGFTLIELVVVLVLLGILGAVATAQFQDLSGEARQAAMQGIAAEIQSGSTINYADGVVQATPTYAVTIDDTSDCSTVAGSLLTGGVPSGWTVAGTTSTCSAAGTTDSSCTLTNDADNAVNTTFSVICTGP